MFLYTHIIAYKHCIIIMYMLYLQKLMTCYLEFTTYNTLVTDQYLQVHFRSQSPISQLRVHVYSTVIYT